MYPCDISIFSVIQKSPTMGCGSSQNVKVDNTKSPQSSKPQQDYMRRERPQTAKSQVIQPPSANKGPVSQPSADAAPEEVWLKVRI